MTEQRRLKNALRRLTMMERAWFWIGCQNGPRHELHATPSSAWDFYNTNGDCLEAK